MSRADDRRKTFTYWRDVSLYVLAACLLVYEAIGRRGEPRWSLLVLYASIFGLPLVLPQVGRNRGDEDDVPGTKADSNGDSDG